jgi:hypothetical protein
VFKFNLSICLILLSTSVFADWATVPNLSSSTLWQLVSESRAEVVSSVGFGVPTGRHEKQTVFRILSAKKSDGDIHWAIKTDGSYRPVMCTETWKDSYNYLGSSCSIPGCTPDNEKCLKAITKNL